MFSIVIIILDDVTKKIQHCYECINESIIQFDRVIMFHYNVIPTLL